MRIPVGAASLPLSPRPSAPLQAAPLPEGRAPGGTAGATAAISGGEGFENSHDPMECAGCHDKPADQLKHGGAALSRARGEQESARSA